MHSKSTGEFLSHQIYRKTGKCMVELSSVRGMPHEWFESRRRQEVYSLVNVNSDFRGKSQENHYFYAGQRFFTDEKYDAFKFY